VIVGGGYIGLEMAGAPHLRGLKITMVQRNTQVMPTLFEWLFITDERKFLLKGEIDEKSKRLVIIAKCTAFDFLD